MGIYACSYLLSGALWTQLMQNAPMMMQVLQVVAAVSAIASTIQTVLGAAPFWPGAISPHIRSGKGAVRAEKDAGTNLEWPFSDLSSKLRISGRTWREMLLVRELRRTPVVPAASLRSVLIIFVCGILIGSLSPRIGDTLMLLYSLRAAWPFVCDHKSTDGATIYGTGISGGKELAPKGSAGQGSAEKQSAEKQSAENPSVAKESAENYVLKDICD